MNFFEKYFGCSRRQINELIHMKYIEICGISKNGLVSENGRKKNSMSIRDGSPTQYVGPYKIFEKKKRCFARKIYGLIHMKK